MHRIKTAATNTWLQISVAAVLAVAAGMFVTSFTQTSGEASASDFAPDSSQAKALADGVITQGEYQSAVNRTLACVRAGGAEVKGQRYEDYRNVPVETFYVQNQPDVKPGSTSVYDGCWMKFSRDVEGAWERQERVKITPAKHAADEKAALACAVEEGLDVSTIAELRELDAKGPQPNGADTLRCLVIAREGFDLKVHPPLTIE